MKKRKRVQISFKNSPSLTKQEFARDADINTICDRYLRNGLPLPEGDRPFMYGDYSVDFDYQKNQNEVNEVTNRFMQYPSEIRKQFGHDPANMLDFMKDPANIEECVKLGLMPESMLPKEPAPKKEEIPPITKTELEKAAEPAKPKTEV